MPEQLRGRLGAYVRERSRERTARLFAEAVVDAMQRTAPPAAHVKDAGGGPLYTVPTTWDRVAELLKCSVPTARKRLRVAQASRPRAKLILDLSRADAADRAVLMRITAKDGATSRKI